MSVSPQISLETYRGKFSPRNLALARQSSCGQKDTAMSERKMNIKATSEQLRVVQVFVALGLIVGIVFIIAGWLLKSDNPDTSTAAYLPTTPNTSETIGSR